MKKEIISLQTISDNEDIQVGYLDNDIAIIDNIQKFAEINAAHVAMNAVAICLRGKAMCTINGQEIEVHKNQVAIIPHDVMVTDLMISPDFDMKIMLFTNRILHSFLHEKMNIWNDVLYIHRMHVIPMEDADIRFYTNFYEMLSLCIDRE